MVYVIRSSNIEDKIMLGKIIQYLLSYDTTKTRWNFNQFLERVENDGSYLGEYKTDYVIKYLHGCFKDIYDDISKKIGNHDSNFLEFYGLCKKSFGNDVAVRLIEDEDNNIIVDVSEPIDFIRLKKRGVVCINLINNDNCNDFGFSDWDYQLFRSGVDIESFMLDVEKMFVYLK